MLEKLAIAIILTLSVNIFTSTAWQNSWLTLTLIGFQPVPTGTQRSLRERSPQPIALSPSQATKATLTQQPAWPTQGVNAQAE